MIWIFAVLVVLLLLKHLLMDWIIQSEDKVHAKGIYGDPKGFYHTLDHMAGTFTVFCVLNIFFPVSLVVVAILLLAEGILHYHIDWAKSKLVKVKKWTMSDKAFWNAIGIDQTLHMLTYIGMALVILL